MLWIINCKKRNRFDLIVQIVAFLCGIMTGCLQMSATIDLPPVSGVLALEEGRVNKGETLQCKRLLVGFVMAVALIGFGVSVGNQWWLESSLGTGQGSPLMGILMPFRVSAGSAAANFMFFAVNAIPENTYQRVSPCIKQGKELITGFTAGWQSCMGALAVWASSELVPMTDTAFLDTAKHYWVSVGFAM